MKYDFIFEIKGNAVVVGGAGGFGQACAEALAERGCGVIITSRSEKNLLRAQKEIKEATGVEVPYIVCDAGDDAQVKKMCEEAIAKLGTVTYLINAQGYNKKYPLKELPEQEWDSMFAANVKSMMLTAKYLGTHMKENGYGKIVNYSSVRGARAGRPGDIAYSTTKGAVNMLTKIEAVELGPEVCVNAVGPAITYTPMMVGILPEDPVERNKMAADKPLQRIGETKDCVGPTLFLLAKGSDFMTGQVIYPDGGLTAIG